MTGRRKIAVAAAVVVLAGIAFWGRKAHERADRRALAAEIERELKAQVRPASSRLPPTSEAEDAAPLWKAALGAMDESVIDDMYDAMNDSDWKEVPEAVRKAEEAHAKAFSLADKAASRSRCSPMPAGQLGHHPMSRLGTLLEARGRAALHRRDGAAALVCVRTLRAIGRDAPRTRSTEKFAWSYPITAHRLQQDALDLLAQVARTPALGVEEEGLALAAGPWNLREFFDESVALRRDALDQDFIGILKLGAEEWLKSMGSPPPTLWERMARAFKGGEPEVVFLLPSPDGIRRFRPHVARLEEAVRRRDVLALARGGPLDRERSSNEMHEVSGFAMPLRPSLMRTAIVVEARLEVVRAALALQVFEKRNGRPAVSWDDLVPTILPSIPLDPGDGKPIRFLVRPGGGAAWSVLSEGPWADERKEEERWGSGQAPPRIDWGTPPK